MFEDWKEIFGEDRSIGENAEDVMDAVNNLINDDNLTRAGNIEGADYNPNQDDIPIDDVGENSSCYSTKQEVVNKSSDKGKKRKEVDLVQGVVDLLVFIGRDTNERLEKIVTRIGYEYDVDEAKKEVFTLLGDIQGLTLDQKFDVCEIFADKTERLLIFKGLPDHARAQYVQRLLKLKHI